MKFEGPEISATLVGSFRSPVLVIFMNFDIGSNILNYVYFSRSKGDPLSCVHKSRQIISHGILLGTHTFYEQETLIALFHTPTTLFMKQTLTFFPYISYPDAEISFKNFFPNLGIAKVSDFFF
jgi:hypothetical protein